MKLGELRRKIAAMAGVMPVLGGVRVPVRSMGRGETLLGQAIPAQRTSVLFSDSLADL